MSAESSQARLAPYNFALRTVEHQAGHDLPIDVAQNIRKWIGEVLAHCAEKTT
jgi:predicted esterase